MAEKQKYIVKDSFRYGGEGYLTGDTIELAAEAAAELDGFIEPKEQKKEKEKGGK